MTKIAVHRVCFTVTPKIEMSVALSCSECWDSGDILCLYLITYISEMTWNEGKDGVWHGKVFMFIIGALSFQGIPLFHILGVCGCLC